MKEKKKRQAREGLTDAELVEKYEGGSIDLKKPIKRLLKTRSNSGILKSQNKP